MLKLTKIFLLFTLVAFMSSCNNDDDNDSTLVGTWSAKTFEANINSSVTFDGNTTTSVSTILGSNFDYDLKFETSTFTTNGSYDIAVTTTVDGNPGQSSNDSYTGVSGDGTYTNTSSEITINGSFFDFEYNGQSFNSAGGEQTIDYQINGDGELVITQNETTNSDSGGVTSTTTIVSTSVWEMQ